MPAPLMLLLAAVALFGAAWALLVPPGQVPDESSHIQYTQSLAERGELPGRGPRTNSSEHDAALWWATGGLLPGYPERKPNWSEASFERWRQLDATLPSGSRRDGGGYIWQGDNPPGYYLYAAASYRLAGGDFFDRLYAMRLASALLLLVTTTGAWLLAGEVFGRNRLLQLATAAFAGLEPMVTFVSAGVNPDAALYATWSLVLWLGARVVRRGLTVPSGAALAALVGVGVVVKATTWALLPAMVLALALGWRRGGPAPGRRAAVIAVVLAFAVPAGGWIVTAAALDRPITNQAPSYPNQSAPSPLDPTDAREFLSYLWQFYLPRQSFQTPFFGTGEGGQLVYQTWVVGGWASFGWLEVKFPDRLYRVLAALSAVAAVASAAAALRALLRRRVDAGLLACGALVVLGLLGAVHWADYTILSVQQIGFAQGRYLLPLVALGGLVVAGALSLLPARLRALGVGLVLGGLVALQLFSLGLVAERYFA